MKIRHAIILYSLMLGVFVSIIDLTVNSIPPLGGKFWDTLLIALNTRKIIEYTSMIFVFLLCGWIIDRFLKEQKRIKGELLHEREFLQILMENVPVSIYFKDLQSRFTRINRYQARVLGVKTPEEALGHTDLDFFPPEPAHEALQDEQNIMKTGQPLTEKMIHYQINDGSHHWFTDTKVPIQDRDGTITGIVGISRGITDLKNMMDRLQESEALFRAVFESSAMGIMLIDRQEYPFQINPAIQNILGYPLDELCHLTLEQVTHPDDIEKGKEMNAQLYAGQCDHYQLEKRYLRKNGEIVWVWLTTSLVRDGEGNILFRMAIMEDITERVKAKQALAEEQSLLRTLFDIIPDLIDVKDTKSRFLLFNQPLMNFFGVKTPEELRGKTDFDFFPADLAETFFSEEQRIMTTGQPMMNRETKLNDGRWLSCCKLPLKNSEGRTVGLVTASQDITERHQAEERINFMSFHDALTGMYNRAFLEEELKRLDAVRQLPLSIIMCDVNGLKVVNDAFGHLEGDTLLIRATEVIKKSTRQEDIVARWGGDEFIILLPRTTETVAHNIANRIQNDCEGDEYAIRLSIAMGSATRIRTDKDIREIIQDAENRMYRNKLTESRTIHTSLIASLERSLWNTTPETEKHVRRMQRLSREVGLVANLKSNQPEELELLARLHDLGKVAIPRDILNKTGPLTKEEWEVVKKHSEIGYRILVSTPEYASLADFVLTHHERWDGTGYPQGLKGEAIPLLARINAVVEAYEVMTTGRPYKLPLPPADTINELQRCAGSQFDPWVVELFVETMKGPRMETLP